MFRLLLIVGFLIARRMIFARRLIFLFFFHDINVVILVATFPQIQPSAAAIHCTYEPLTSSVNTTTRLLYSFCVGSQLPAQVIKLRRSFEASAAKISVVEAL